MNWAAIFFLCIMCARSFPSETGTVFVYLPHSQSDGISVSNILKFEGYSNFIDSDWNLFVVGEVPNIKKSLWCISCADVNLQSLVHLDSQIYLSHLIIHFHMHDILTSWVDKPFILRNEKGNDLGVIDFQFFLKLPIEFYLAKLRQDQLYIPLNISQSRILNIGVTGAELNGFKDGFLLLKKTKSAEDIAITLTVEQDDSKEYTYNVCLPKINN